MQLADLSETIITRYVKNWNGRYTQQVTFENQVLTCKAEFWSMITAARLATVPVQEDCFSLYWGASTFSASPRVAIGADSSKVLPRIEVDGRPTAGADKSRDFFRDPRGAQGRSRTRVQR